MIRPDAYYAGLIDGESWIAVIEKYGSGQYRCCVDVTMTHEATVRSLYERFGGSVTPRPPQQEHHLPLWRWRAYGKTARRVLIAIRPYVITKRDAVEESIRFLKETGKW